jgi:hypothetical protein
LARLDRRIEHPDRKLGCRVNLSSLADEPCGSAMNRKTLHEFAELHAPTEMRRWREAHTACQLRALSGDEGETDLANREDPFNIATQAEVEIEAAVLAEVLKEGRYTIEGRRNGTVERLSSYTKNRLRLALGTGGVIEIDHEGRTANAWSDCDVIDEGMDKAVTQPVPPSGSQAPWSDAPNNVIDEGTADARKLEPQSETLQVKFDAAKRQRINVGAKHGYDAMTGWARHELKVDSNTAHELWTNRSSEFSRQPGAPSKGRKSRKEIR